MKRRDVSPHVVDTILAHPQVLKQCRSSLSRKYPGWKLESGEGDLIDTAQAAKALSEGRLRESICILGSKDLSRLYDLKIIDKNLQDDKENYTSFMLVCR